MSDNHQDPGRPDALTMARNAASFVSAAGAMQASDDEEVRLRARVYQVGAQAADAAGLAGRLATLAIAEQLVETNRLLGRLADALDPERRHGGE